MQRKRTVIAIVAALAAVASIVAVVVFMRGGSPEGASKRPNVLFICVDTLRADRVGAFGGPEDLTPNMDALAARGTKFSLAMSPAPFTAPSVTTICTGVAPLVHGVRSWESFARRYEGPTLAATLGAHGYRTAFLGANGFLKPIAPVREGFERFDEWRDLPGSKLTQHALADIDAARDDDRPWAVWVHYFDPHVPYRSHAKFADRFTFEGLGTTSDDYPWEWNDRIIEKLYDGEVAAVDVAIGELIEGLRRRGMLDDTLVVLTADHGENMAEHEPYFGHNDTLYDTLIHVPLIFAGPGVLAGRHDADLATLSDVARTTLEIVGIPVPIDLGGTSLAPSTRGEARVPSEMAHSDSGLQRTRLLSFRTTTSKLVRDAATTPAQWTEYRLERDPGEALPREIPLDDPRIPIYEAWIAKQMREHQSRLGPARAGPERRTEEEIRHLKAFGYLR